MKKVVNYLKSSKVEKFDKLIIENFTKLIMLTFFACCVTITLVGCENGNKNIDKLTSGEMNVVNITNAVVNRRKRKRRGRRSL